MLQYLIWWLSTRKENEDKKLFKCLICGDHNAEDVRVHNGKIYRVCNSCGASVAIHRGDNVQSVYPKPTLANESTAEYYFVEGA